MQDHSHKFLFLALTGVMSAAALYGSQAGPTLLMGNDPAPAAQAFATQHEVPTLSRAVLATEPGDREVDCTVTGADLSSLCLAKSKVSLSTP